MSHNTYCYKCGGNCAWHCGNCNPQPTNTSNKTEVIPVAGANNYLLWLSYNPDKDPNTNPDSPWTEKYWVDNYAKGEKGDKGDGVQIKGSVPTYADLSSLINVQLGDSWAVDEDGMLYTYGINGFPAQGQGIQLQGEKGEDGADGTDGNSYIPVPTTSYFDI